MIMNRARTNPGCPSCFVSRHVAVVVQDVLQRGWSVLWCVIHVQLYEMLGQWQLGFQQR